MRIGFAACRGRIGVVAGSGLAVGGRGGVLSVSRVTPGRSGFAMASSRSTMAALGLFTERRIAVAEGRRAVFDRVVEREGDFTASPSAAAPP